MTNSHQICSAGSGEAIHYLMAILERLNSLYELLPDDPRLREHISDEVDWVEAEIVRLNNAAKGPTEPLQCLRCGTIDAFGPASKKDATNG